MRQLLVACLLILNFTYSWAQEFSAWSEHLPYRKAKQLVASDENVYCLTESGLFYYSLVDNEIVSFSKTKGLSDTDISCIAWADNNEVLIVAYENGNLDLIFKEEIINISDIKRFSAIDNKFINSISVYENWAYLGTNFGIVVVNLDKKEIADTYIIGENGRNIKINDIVLKDNTIWAASDEGIYLAEFNSTNLADFNNWKRDVSIPNYERACDEVQLVGDDLFVLRTTSFSSSEIYKYQNGNWTNFIVSSTKINSLSKVGSALCLSKSESIDSYDSSGGKMSSIEFGSDDDFRDVLKLNERTFIADYEKSLIEVQGNSFVRIKPDGPMRSDISSIYSVGDKTWAVAGNHNNLYNNKNIDAELFLYDSNNWRNFTSENFSELNGKKDLLSITSNAINESVVYVGSWGDGIFVFENKEFKTIWNSDNSPLQSKGVISMSSDLDGNLWVLDANSSNAVKVLTYNKEWISLAYSGLSNRLDMQKILALSNGDKWVLRKPGNSLYAFNENSSIANGDDDVVKSFVVKDENNSTISSYIYDMAEDENGSLWLASSSGVAVYTDPGTIFRDGDFYAYRPVITINGSTQYLLSTENVKCIAINGANQKWLGTESSGVFLVSENGDEQLAYFNTNNSPLPSNKIEKISVNPGTGEVFFVTDKGLVSYKGKVTEGTDNFKELYVYPNPVRETYDGDITVSGLIKNSIVKITDVSGNLVWEGKSEGGQFIWDGNNFNGSRVHTGVYLIFCSNTDGSKSKVIKLLFIH